MSSSPAPLSLSKRLAMATAVPALAVLAAAHLPAAALAQFGPTLAEVIKICPGGVYDLGPENGGTITLKAFRCLIGESCGVKITRNNAGEIISRVPSCGYRRTDGTVTVFDPM